MNRNNLKKYAPQARRNFIQAVTDRASYYGLTKKKTEPVTVEGDVAVITGRAFPKKVGEQRKQLGQRVGRQGFDQVMEAMAYTWFNRLIAIRFMELHGYLEHGYRVLSHPAGSNTPEILEHADSVDLPGLDPQQVIDLKLAGDKDAELYRMLLIAQCNALHKAMPFLFEKIDDETELLLPDNLLHSDSLIRTLVNEIPEEDWQEVEIIGWLYQFYISEKKDQVIGKVVKSEDIPAATQLFTPNWIVKYLVQNSLGRQWVATYPNSSLKKDMEYYIEPAEQTREVQEQLNAITPDKLDPEELTLMDPAAGSGHILCEGYDLFKAIYLERGFSKKDIPRLILEKNLYGLEIDDRAAQLASLALMMKARADDRRIFTQGVQPHVLSIQESKGLDAKEITEALNAPILMTELPPSGELFEEIAEEKSPLFSKKNLSIKGDISQADITRLIDLFEHGKTFGSLIQVPEALAEKLPAVAKRVEDVIAHGGMFEQATVRSLKCQLKQAQLLSHKYGAIVMNPPYLSAGAMTTVLKEFVGKAHPRTKADLFAVFVERATTLASQGGQIGLMSPFTWMFIKSYEAMRQWLLSSECLWSLIKPEYHAFFDSAYVPVCAFVFQNAELTPKGTFIDLSRFYGESLQPLKALEAISNSQCEWRHDVETQEFGKIPGSPLAFTVSHRMRDAFTEFAPASESFFSDGLTKTGNNEKYLRMWWEVSVSCATDENTYRLCAKGGDARRYFGNTDIVVKWTDTTRRHFRDDRVARITPEYLWDREGITWTKISSKGATFRLMEAKSIAETGGPTVFTDAGEDRLVYFLSFLNSPIAEKLLSLINPTLNIQTADVLKLPLHVANESKVVQLALEAIATAKADWNSSETSLSFQRHPIASTATEHGTLASCSFAWERVCADRIKAMLNIEEEKNHLLIVSYDLDGEVSPVLPETEVTLYRPNREEDIQRLISFAVGCMMGRYSLDRPGLIYAHSGNEGFDPGQYETFPADDDGIVPITEFQWFDDDAANRVEQFIATAWPEENLEENLNFVAESIGQKKSESARDAIRRYLSTGFYKHHLSLYKRRPIYWLFSSGKQRAFQCLVYLHRYNAGTLARMRTEYVIPLSGKIDARIEQLAGDIAAASSTSHAKKLTKERDTLIRHSEELQKFDEKLKHYADQRIELDLDEGVKVNYGRFGDLLSEVKAVTGKPPQEDIEFSPKKKGIAVMKIRHVEVTNFKSLVDFQLSLSSFTCLVGLNGSGKTTLLQFFDFLSALVRGEVTEWLDERQWKANELKSKLSRKNNIEFTVGFGDDGSSISATWEGSFNPTTLNCTSETIKIGPAMLEVSQGELIVNDGHKPQNKSQITFDYEGSILSALKDSALPHLLIEARSAIRGIKCLDLLSPDEMRLRSASGRKSLGRGGRGLASVIYSLEPTDRKRIAHQLRSIYRQLDEIDSKSLSTGKTQLEITESFGKTTFSTDSFHVNDGMLRLIAILSELQADRHVLFFDEIENGINPEIVEYLVDTLVASPQQIVVTTHNPMVLNYIEDDIAKKGVIYVYKGVDGQTKAIPFFSIPSCAEKLTVMGPGEVFVDTNLTELNEEIESLAKGE